MFALKFVAVWAMLYVFSATGQVVPPSVSRLQKIRFFTNNNCNGQTPTSYTDFSDSRNTTDISRPYQSYCVLSGAWRVEYAWLQNPTDFNISVGDGCTTCISRGTGNRYFGFIRHLAGRELTKPSISLYTERGFTGEEIIINGNELTFDSTRTFLSFAYTSYSNWTWRTYYLPHFRGNSTCHRPHSGEEVTYFDAVALNVGSIRLGCRNSATSSYKNSGFIVAIVLAMALPTIAVIL